MKKTIAAVLMMISLSAVFAQADDFARTCRTLGQVGQCENVTFCQERTEGMCIPKIADRNNPEWIRACAASGPDAKWCGYQAFCQWEEVTACVPKGRF